MIIANPIYDVVFKKLMENKKIAKFFISTLLDEEIISLEIKPQEYTYKGELETEEGIKAVTERLRERFSIWVYRLDFVATIKTENGEYKKVLIEIQKAKNPIDLMRFRNYLAEQYKKQDQIGYEKQVLPITTIYILGFKLPEIESPCIKVARNYIDLIHQKTISEKSEFVEKLTHDSFVVQVERITERYQTRLDKLLSLFEQRNFTDDKEITKDYPYSPDIEEVREIMEILHYVGTEPSERKEIEKEQEARRTIDALLENYRKRITEQQKALIEKDKALNEQQKALEDKEKSLDEQQKALADKNKALDEQQKAISEKDRLIEELMRKLKDQE